MKTIFSILAVVATLFLPLTSTGGEIEFHITGVKPSKGKLFVQLFKGQQSYHLGKPESATIVKADNGMAVITFNNLEQGEYGVRYFHDENDNGEMETNLFGMPVEGYGFSNNAKPNFGPLSFKQISFSIAQDSKVVNTSQVIY